MENKEDSLIKDFESHIKSFEEHLFGLTLYYDTTPKLIRWSQKSSYKNVKNRIEHALSDAKKLLDEVKNGHRSVHDLQEFNWLSRWEPMEDRVNLLLRAYKVTFSNRSKKKLSKKEIKMLRQTVMKIL